MAEYRHSAHAVFDLKYQKIWCTRYRYKILRGRVAERARHLIRGANLVLRLSQKDRESGKAIASAEDRYEQLIRNVGRCMPGDTRSTTREP